MGRRTDHTLDAREQDFARAQQGDTGHEATQADPGLEATQQADAGHEATTPAAMAEQATVAAGAEDARASVTAETEGRYQIRRELGSGGQARVFVAYDTHLGREIAFKQPRDGGRGSEAAETLGRFLREARITARLEHPNIVPVYEIGRRADGSYYCAQKLIRSTEGEEQPRTLRRAFAEARSLEERLALLPHFLDVCHAIAYAHEHGVIHRDIKPDNVVIGRLGETVVLDWGIAKVLGEEAGEPRPGHRLADADVSGGETEYGYAFGTPSYMSPEQAAGHLDQIDERSDIWSLGAVLYELLTGRPPHTGKNAREIVQRVIDEVVVPVRTRSADAPPALAAVAEKALGRSREERYASAADLAGEIAAFSAGLRVGVYRYSLFELLKLFVNRHRAASAVTAIGAILLAASSAVAWWNYRQAEGYLAGRRQSLARAFVEKARRAEQRLQWDRAAAYYAAARAEADLPEARWGAMLTENHKDVVLGRFVGHEGEVADLAFSPDGALLATVGSDKTVRLWDVETRQQVRELEIESSPYAVDYAPDGSALVTADSGGAVRLFDLESEEEKVIHQHPDEVNTVAFSPDGASIVAGTADYHILAYDLADRDILFDRELSPYSIYTTAYAPDGGAIFAGGRDGAVHALDPASGERLRTIEDAHRNSVLALSLSPDGELLATGGADKMVKIWKTSDGTLVHQLEGHAQKVYTVAFSPDGQLLASGSTDKTVRLWSVQSGQALVGDSFGLEDQVGGVRFSPDGDRLAWVGEETVWLRRFEELPKSPSRKDIESLDVSPDGSLLAAMFDNQLVFRDPENLEEIARLGKVGSLPHGRFSPDGELFASTSSNYRGPTLLVWDVKERTSRRELKHPAAVRSAAFSPDGRLVAAGLGGGTIKLWNTETWEEMETLEAGSKAVLALAFSPDGKTLASGTYDALANVFLWDTETWTLRERLEGHTHGVRRVAFSPDGELLATASWDRDVRLWDPATGEAEDVLEGHQDYVFGLAFDPEGRFLVSGGWDGTLRVWGLDGRREHELAVFVTDEERVFSVTVLPGGDAIAYAGKNVHRIELGELGPPAQELERVLEETGLELRDIDLERRPPRDR